MNMPALSAAMSLRRFNHSLMRQFLNVQSVAVKLRKSFQMLGWFLKAPASIKLIHAKIQSRKIPNQLINLHGAADGSPIIRDLAHSALFSYRWDQLRPWSLLEGCLNRSPY